MTTKSQLLAFGPACAVLLGCAATPIEPTAGFSHIDSRELVYDEIVFDIVDPGSETPMDVTLETRGAGAKDGLKMMLQAPVGCLQAGPMFAAVCLSLVPFFPFMAAGDVQDVETSRAELQTMAARIDHADLHRRFRESIETEAREAGLPLVASASPHARVAVLHAELGRPSLEHDGREDGSIALTQPYRFSLSYGNGRTETLIEGENFARFDVEHWSETRTAELERRLERWIVETATLGVHDTVLEWQPKVVLGPVAPTLTERRNAIGIKTYEFPFVESTSPRLAWQPLEAVLEPDVLAEVSDVSYELEVFRPTGARHTVTGLDTPEFVVTVDLAPCAYYYWRPRARFRYRGVVHTTSLNMRRWSKAEFVSDDFIFKTPSADCEDPSWYDPEPVAE